MHKNETERGALVIRALTAAVLGGLVGLAACLVFCLLSSVAVSAGWLRETMIYQICIAGCLLGGVFGGVTAVRRCRVRTLFVGLGAGASLFLLLLVVGIPLLGRVGLADGWPGLLCGALVGGALAGLFGRTTKKRRK